MPGAAEQKERETVTRSAVTHQPRVPELSACRCDHPACLACRDRRAASKGLTRAQTALLTEAALKRPNQSLFPEGAALVNARRMVRAGLLESVYHRCAETPAFRITKAGLDRLSTEKRETKSASPPTS